MSLFEIIEAIWQTLLSGRFWIGLLIGLAVGSAYALHNVEEIKVQVERIKRDRDRYG